jgi:hypothetical protein
MEKYKRERERETSYSSERQTCNKTPFISLPFVFLLIFF